MMYTETWYSGFVAQGDNTIRLNPLPEDKILDWSKFQQIADDILQCT